MEAAAAAEASRRAARWIAVVGLAALAGCDGPSSSQPRAAAQPMTPAEGRARFCQVVFDPATVTRLTGLTGPRPRPSGRPAEPGVGECIYLGDGGATAELVADCRPLHPRLDTLRHSMMTAPGYREVDLGTGGAYAYQPGNTMHRLVFVTAEPSCALYLSTTGLVTDATRALGQHVLGRVAGQPTP